MTATSLLTENRNQAAFRLPAMALAFFGAALVLCGEALATSDVPTHAVVWGSVALASYAAGLLCLVGHRMGAGLGLGRWKICPWVLAWYGVSFGLATVTWSRPQASTAMQIEISSVLRALWLVAVGLTFLTLGYFVGPSRILRRFGILWIGILDRHFADTIRSPITPWLIYAVGVAARVASAVTTGRFGYVGDAASAVSTSTGYEQVLSSLSLLAPFAVCAAALQVYRERLPGARFTLAALFLAEVVFGAAAGGKEDFVIAVLAVGIPFSAARHRLPKIGVIVGVVFFLVIIIPFNQAYRSNARGGSNILSTTQALDAAPGILRNTITSHNMLTVFPDSVIYLTQRVREIDSPAIIMQRSPAQIRYSSSIQLVEAPLTDMVPRAIWSGKPILATGYEFTHQYLGLPATIYSSSSITPIGDLYRHGGWIPVIAGMFVLGFMMRLLDDVLEVRKNPHAIFLILLLFPSLVKGEQDWVTLMASVPTTVVVWLIAVRFAFRRKDLA